MRDYSVRLATLGVLGSDICKEQFAKAGFYIPRGKDLHCFHCDLVLGAVTAQTDPWIEHARWQPRCSFLRMARDILFMWSVRDVIKEE